MSPSRGSRLWKQIHALWLVARLKPGRAAALFDPGNPAPPWLASLIAWEFSAHASCRYQEAMKSRGAEAVRLFELAARAYEAALAVKPDFHPARHDRGVTYSDQARRKTGEEAERLLALACEDLRAALDMEPHPHHWMALNNLGLVFSRQARLAAGEAVDRLFAQAGEQFAASLDLKPNREGVLSNWGVALWQQAKRKSGPEADRLFAQAYEKFTAALAIRPGHNKSLQNWGGALMNQAQQKSGEEAERLFAASREKLLDAESRKPGSGAYNLACLCGMRGEPECRRWLEKSLATGDLFGRPDLASEPAFDSARDAWWFQDIAACQAAGPTRRYRV